MPPSPSGAAPHRLTLDAPLAHVTALWRFPVKSMGGESVPALRVVPDGIASDRRFALISTGAPVGKPRLTSQERASLLRYTAAAQTNRTGEESGRVSVTTPTGAIFDLDDPALLRHLQTHLPGNHALTLEHSGNAGPYTDVRPIALVSTQTLAALDQTFGEPVDPRRFRSNFVLTFTAEAAAALTAGNPDTFPEDALAGQIVALGPTCRLRLLERIPRCRVVTLDPGTAEPNPALMKHLDRRHDGRLGIYAAVEIPGTVALGDAVRLIASPPQP